MNFITPQQSVPWWFPISMRMKYFHIGLQDYMIWLHYLSDSFLTTLPLLHATLAMIPPCCFAHRSASLHLRDFYLTIPSPWNALPLDIYITNTACSILHLGSILSTRPSLITPRSLLSLQYFSSLSLCSDFFPFHLSFLIHYAIYSFIMYMGSCLFLPTKMSTPRG